MRVTAGFSFSVCFSLRTVDRSPTNQRTAIFILGKLAHTRYIRPHLPPNTKQTNVFLRKISSFQHAQTTRCTIADWSIGLTPSTNQPHNRNETKNNGRLVLFRMHTTHQSRPDNQQLGIKSLRITKSFEPDPSSSVSFFFLSYLSQTKRYVCPMSGLYAPGWHYTIPAVTPQCRFNYSMGQSDTEFHAEITFSWVLLAAEKHLEAENKNSDGTCLREKKKTF